MRKIHLWHVRPIAVLAVVVFSLAHLAHSAEPQPEAGAKSAKIPEAASTAAGPLAAPALAPLLPPAAEKSAPPPEAKPAAKEAAGPGSESPRRRRTRSSRSGGPSSATEEGAAPTRGQDSSPATKSATVAAPPLTSTSKSEKPSIEAPNKKAEKLRFQFRFQPWKDVLDWFAKQADLSLVIPETIPQGTFNYSDTREYTPAEAIDLLNMVLQTKGYMLVRHERMLMLVNTEDPIPPNLVLTVAVESLDNRGESELANVHFKLSRSGPKTLRPKFQNCSARRDRSRPWPSRRSCPSPIRWGGFGRSAPI